jgi:DMSO/TMAO reductase YedYZ molybdopterin-dependent catalytic subunit
VALGAAVVAAGGSALSRARTASAAKLRGSVALPVPASGAGALNPAAGFYTANRDFYRVDTALTVPRVDPNGWRLRVHGMVDHPMTLDFASLTARPVIERDITLNCVSNEVGGPYVGTARWLGVPLAPLLREAGIGRGADQIVARSVDGMTIGTPLATAMDGRDTMLAVAMNGEPLPLEHGFPVRMLTPGLYGYVGACKWIVDLELTTFAAYDPYWVKRGWAARAPVKTASRIDRPQPLSTVPAGSVQVKGVAWAQHRGITTVEVRVDDQPWRPARLLPVSTSDTWVQWVFDWAATAGEHQLTVRAADGTGAVQPERRAPTFPDGSAGWHSVSVTVR